MQLIDQGAHSCQHIPNSRLDIAVVFEHRISIRVSECGMQSRALLGIVDGLARHELLYPGGQIYRPHEFKETCQNFVINPLP